MQTKVRAHDWASGATVAALLVTLGGLLGGSVAWTSVGLAATALLVLAARAFSHGDPSPMPHAFRWVLYLPRGSHSPRHLVGLLKPERGERILEVGPGIGIHALPVATRLGADGRLDALDAQPAMLADLERRAQARNVTNIVARAGTAEQLPYADDSFDAAYLIGVLGEIPDPDSAFRELHRVLKPTGRLVVGETMLDPDYVTTSVLTERATAAGFALEKRRGPRFTYLARFTIAPQTSGDTSVDAR